MLVKRPDENTLILEDRPGFFSAACGLGTLVLAFAAATRAWKEGWGGDAIGFGVGTLFFAASFAVITRWNFFLFDKRTRTCRWKMKHLFGGSEGETRFDDIERVRLDVLNNDPPPSYRAVMETKDGLIPFTHYYAGGMEDSEAVASMVRAFLERPLAKP